MVFLCMALSGHGFPLYGSVWAWFLCVYLAWLLLFLPASELSGLLAFPVAVSLLSSGPPAPCMSDA